MEKHEVETEFRQKYGITVELICPTDCTDGSLKYGRKEMYHKPGMMPTWSPSTKKETEQNVVITEVYLLSAAGKIFPRTLLNRLSSHITPEVVQETHSRHDLLPTTTPGKVHRAGSTSVYCLCRLHEGI